MSIINDALKKVQQNLDRYKKPGTPSPRPAEPVTKDHIPNFSKVIILGSFLVSLTVLGFIFMSKPKNASLTPVQEASMPHGSSEPAAKTVVPPAASKGLADQNDKASKNRIVGLTLNGIIKMDENYVALINNKIAKQGDTIGDKKILSISESEVKIFFNGETATLRLGRF